MNSDFDSDLDPFIEAAMGRKAFGIVALDVRELTTVADAFIICSGRSNRQVTAIADFIVTDLKKKGVRPLHVEGKSEGHWVLVDYGHVVIHVFYEPVRSFYDLEGLWSDAKRVRSPRLSEAPDWRDGEDDGDNVIEEFIE